MTLWAARHFACPPGLVAATEAEVSIPHRYSQEEIQVEACTSVLITPCSVTAIHKALQQGYHPVRCLQELGSIRSTRLVERHGVREGNRTSVERDPKQVVILIGMTWLHRGARIRSVLEEAALEEEGVGSEEVVVEVG